MTCEFSQYICLFKRVFVCVCVSVPGSTNLYVLEGKVPFVDRFTHSHIYTSSENTFSKVILQISKTGTNSTGILSDWSCIIRSSSGNYTAERGTVDVSREISESERDINPN